MEHATPGIFSSIIARRLITYVILFSSLITLIATAFQLYLDYDKDINYIEDSLQQIQTVHLNSLSETLWASDARELRTHVEGILQMRDMQFLEIRDDDRVWVRLGTPQSQNTIQRQFTMTHQFRNHTITIGTLTVVASLKGVYQRLIDRVWIILFTNAIKTFLVAGFIFVIFHTLVTRHLVNIAEFTRNLDPETLGTPLELETKGRRKHKPDELDLVVDAFRQMQNNIQESFNALKDAERKLKNHREHLEEQVVSRTSELNRINKELETFSYSVSHDLRAPLRGIDGFSLALLEDYSDILDDTGKDYLKRVRTASQRMSVLIDDLLELSRVARSNFSKQSVCLSELAEEAIKQLQQENPDRNIEITIDQGIHAHGDPHLLAILLDNLISNAWKYTGKTSQPWIHFGNREIDGKTVYFVEDNGAGFDMNYADKLFGAFQRLHGNEFEGTGIGLATAARIVGRHAGRIWADSPTDQGAIFMFTL
ncbi:Phytochrome, two-component sensor histidine kinase [hydrothermal vent metagenome]|uniref:histidine kinase n=1 Tax=hydrothermal vent metagenome TaxID=652676 RepID=A0A3B0YFL5_9ZZZZ